MPAVNDSIPTPNKPASNAQQYCLFVDSLAAEQLMGMQPDSTIYRGKTITAQELYGVRSVMLAKPVNTYTMGDGTPREHPLSGSWAFIPVIGVLLLVLLLLRYTRGYLGRLLMLLVSDKRASKQYQSNFQNFNHTLLALVMFAIVPSTMLATYILNTFPNQLTAGNNFGYELYLVAGGFLLGLFALKSLVLSIAGVLTYEEKLIHKLRYNGRIFAGAWGITAVSFVILLTITDSEANKLICFYTTAALTILLIILYLIRSFQLFFSKKVSVFFWILYLCTLELLPVLLVFDYLFPFR